MSSRCISNDNTLKSLYNNYATITSKCVLIELSHYKALSNVHSHHNVWESNIYYINCNHAYYMKVTLITKIGIKFINNSFVTTFILTSQFID